MGQTTYAYPEAVALLATGYEHRLLLALTAVETTLGDIDLSPLFNRPLIERCGFSNLDT